MALLDAASSTICFDILILIDTTVEIKGGSQKGIQKDVLKRIIPTNY